MVGVLGGSKATLDMWDTTSERQEVGFKGWMLRVANSIFVWPHAACHYWEMR